eukprot:gene5391-8871_t
MSDTNPMYSASQITIPSTFPEILKQYTKAAIRTQPDDLLLWSAQYFEALSAGNPLPVSSRVVTQPTHVIDKTVKGARYQEEEYRGDELHQSKKTHTLSVEMLKSLASQFLHPKTNFSVEETYDVCNNLGISSQHVNDVLAVGEFQESVPGIPFISLLAAVLKPRLTETCKLLAQLSEATEESLPMPIFEEALEFLGSLEKMPRNQIDGIINTAAAAVSPLTPSTIDSIFESSASIITEQLSSSEILKELLSSPSSIEAIRAANPGNRTARHFDKAYFSTLTFKEKQDLLRCCRSGIDNPDSSMGCYAMQPSDYDRFKPFFQKVIADYHGVGESAKHVNNWDLSSVEGLPSDGRLDLAALGLPELSMRVRVGRNLADFPLPGAMTRDDRILLENK